jgi:phenylacetaldehyde dehydrogenase
MSTQPQAISVSTAPQEVQEFLQNAPAHVVGGAKRPSGSGEEIEVVDPSTGDVISHIARGRSEDVDAAVQAADSALRSSSWTKASPATRESLMHRLATLIDENIETLAFLESLDNGMPLPLAQNLDIAGAAGVLRYMAGWPTKIDGRTMAFESPFGNRVMGQTRREPVGVVGGIIPWNVPFMLAIWKVAPALAAGCTIVLKPAEDTSLTALFLGDLVLAAGFPPGVVNIVTGTGPEAGQPLIEHPLVSKVFFTGSTTTGIAVARAAASHTKPVSLELGGKSPTIIFADADLEAAAAGAAEAIFLNSGQICVAGSRLYVQKKVYDDVVNRVASLASEHVLGNSLDPTTTLGPVISRRHKERVDGYIDAAENDGAELISSHTVPDQGFFVAPTIVTGAEHGAAITQEEVFGPVLAVYPFDDEADVLQAANGTPYGLAATVWTSSIGHAEAMIDGLECGKVSVNSPGFPYPGLPEGGKKASGYGRDLGPESLDGYLHSKSVIFERS